MSERKGFTTSTIILLMVSLLIGSAAGYLYTNNSLQPQINSLKTQVSDQSDTIDSLNNEVEDLSTQKNTLDLSVKTLESTLNEKEDEISELNNQLTESNSMGETLQKRVTELSQMLTDFYEMNPIQIGITSSTTEMLETTQAVSLLAEREINKYSQKNDLPYRFEFVLGDNEGDANTALDNTMLYDIAGIDLIVGHGWSSQCQAALIYVNQNDMLLLSPGSTSPLLAIKNDNLYRTSPPDTVLAKPIVACYDAFNISAVIVLYRNDMWGQLVYESIDEVYGEAGGVIYKVIPYSPTSTSFTSKLATAEAAAEEAVKTYGASHVGVQLICFDEGVQLLNTINNYPTMFNLTWFGTDGNALTAYSWNYNSNAAHVKVYSPLAGRNSTKFDDFTSGMSEFTHNEVGYYTATMYDACWLYALSVMDVGSTNVTEIKSVLPDIAADYEGASGYIVFNESGDRENSDYQIFSFELESGRVIDKIAGYYSSQDNLATISGNP